MIGCTTNLVKALDRRQILCVIGRQEQHVIMQGTVRRVRRHDGVSEIGRNSRDASPGIVVLRDDHEIEFAAANSLDNWFWINFPEPFHV